MLKSAPSEWTVDELTARVALALAEAPGQPSARVRDVPDLRAIRYYTTLGLLDRPLSFRGRTAIYGKRHLAQVVAIKRLQSQGLPLAQVQRTLSQLDEHALYKLAAVPHHAEAETVHRAEAPAPAAAPARADFWKAAPTEIAPSAPALNQGPSLQSAPLDSKVLLVLEGSRPLNETDLEAIRAAAAPLLKLLQKRGLLGPPNPEEV